MNKVINSTLILDKTNKSFFYKDMEHNNIYSVILCENNPYKYNRAQLTKLNNDAVKVDLLNQSMKNVIDSMVLPFSFLRLIKSNTREISAIKNLTLSDIVNFAMSIKYMIDNN